MANGAAAGSGAIQGAASGATAGAAVGGPWGAAIGGVVGGAAGALGGAFGGGSSTSGYTLPPEYELQYLQYFQNSQQQLSQQLAFNQSLYGVYDTQMKAIYGSMQGMIPSDQALRALTDTSQQIAQMFGGNSLEAIKAGFLDKSMAKYTGLIEEREGQTWNANQAELDKISSGSYTNPALENQLTDQRRQLEQDLARSGVGPAQRAIALQQFERSASEQRFSAGQTIGMGNIAARQQMLGGSVGALGQAGQMYLSGQQNQFNQALQGYNVGQSQLGFAQQGLAGMAGLSAAQFGTGQQFLGFGQQTLANQGSLYQQMGQFNLSDQTRHLLEMGQVGPGSTYQQTGFARSQIENAAQAYESTTRDQSVPSADYQNYFGAGPYQPPASKGQPVPLGYAVRRFA